MNVIIYFFYNKTRFFGPRSNISQPVAVMKEKDNFLIALDAYLTKQLHNNDAVKH